jgi:trimeric autotransporter adhesin
MSSNYHEISESESFKVDGDTFHVTNELYNFTSLDLQGSSNTVILDGDGVAADISGNNNRVMGGGQLHISGTLNTVNLDAGSFVIDEGTGNNLTVGANSKVEAGINSKVYARQGGDRIWTATGTAIWGTNNEIYWNQGSFSLNGNSNNIDGRGPKDELAVLSLSGSNNAINMYAGEKVAFSGTDYLTDNTDGSIVTGGTVGTAGMTLTNGVLTMQLDKGNVPTVNDVYSNSKIEHIDKSGVSTWTTINDTNLFDLGGTYQIRDTSRVKVLMDGGVFDVLGNEYDHGEWGYTRPADEFYAKLTVKGSSNYITVENLLSVANVIGDNNTITGNNGSVGLSGTGNTVNLGDGGYVGDSGTGNFITVGAGSSVAAGVNSQVYAYKGGCWVNTHNGTAVYGNNNYVRFGQSDFPDTVNVYGNNNTIDGWRTQDEVATLNLSGSNNTINVYSGEKIVLSDKDYLLDNIDGSIVTGGTAGASEMTLTDNVLTMQLGNGNVATVNDVWSGSEIQHIDAKGVSSWTTVMDTNLLDFGDRYQLRAGTTLKVRMDSSNFELASAGRVEHDDVYGYPITTLVLQGSFNYVALDNWQTWAYITGDGNSVDVNTGWLQISGTNNSVTVQAGGSVWDQGTYSMITLGANASITAGAYASVYAFQGGGHINAGNGASVYGNNDEIWWSEGTLNINGNNNKINSDSQSALSTLNLGSTSRNNIIGVHEGEKISLAGSSKNYLMERIDGSVVVSGTLDASTLSLTDGTLTVQLGGGNVATIEGVNSGSKVECISQSGVSTWTTLVDHGSSPMLSAVRSTDQLVSAMASYSVDAGAANTTATSQSSNDTMFQATLVAA